MSGTAVSLADAPLHRPLTVVAIDGDDASRRGRLSVLGIIPGTRLTLRQRRPSYVVEADETLLALEREVAALIRVDTL